MCSRGPHCRKLYPHYPDYHNPPGTSRLECFFFFYFIPWIRELTNNKAPCLFKFWSIGNRDCPVETYKTFPLFSGFYFKWLKFNYRNRGGPGVLSIYFPLNWTLRKHNNQISFFPLKKNTPERYIWREEDKLGWEKKELHAHTHKALPKQEKAAHNWSIVSFFVLKKKREKIYTFTVAQANNDGFSKLTPRWVRRS